jgi:hypothetical protein
MIEGGDRLVEGEIDMARHHVPYDVGGAGLVRHEAELRAGRLLEIDAADVLAGAEAGGSLGGFVRVGLEPGDHVLEVFSRKILADHGDVRVVRQAHDRLEILLDVVAEIVDRAVGDERRPVADADRVAVGCSAHHACHADGAVGAGDVLDHHGLAEVGPHRFGHGAAHGVGRAARAIRHDERDRARRIVLGHRAVRKRHEQSQAKTQPMHRPPRWMLRAGLPTIAVFISSRKPRLQAHLGMPARRQGSRDA